MKKAFLSAVVALSSVSTYAETNPACFQAQNAIEIGIASGAGWTSSAFSQLTSSIQPSTNSDTYTNYFGINPANPAVVLETDNSFFGSSLKFGSMTQFNSNMSWSGEFSVAGKFVLGGNLFARLSAFIGANLGFSQASVPVVGLDIEVTTTPGTDGTVPVPATIESVSNPSSVCLATKKDVTVKSGLGYGIMLGLGKETSFGSMSVDLGVVFRTFSFYFPSATPKQAAAGTAIAFQGFTNVDDSTAAPSDLNTYGSYYNRFTQAGFRFGGSLSFKLIENLSFGISVSAEIFGNKSITINPNISSFTNTPPATTTATTPSSNSTDTATTNGSINGSNIVNTNMMYNNFTAMAKNVVTNVMMTLTYSVPVGN